jgi:hypothetical protein
MIRAIFILSFLLTTFLNGFCLKDKITKGQPGDFVVTEQAGTYTVLLIRSISPEYLILEEIDIPTINHNHETVYWKEWIGLEAPGHTAWISYLIDLQSNRLLECFSHSKGTWLYADDPNNFLARLMTLSLEKTPEDKRKRIGPPIAGEIDHRSLWKPAITFEGKALDKAPISVWSTRWPQDNSIIANCEIEVYFSQFAFPYWIEIKSPHYKASIRTLDTGTKMSSPKNVVYQQSPFFIGGNQWKSDHFELHLHSPLYYSDLRLFAYDMTEDSHPLIEILEIKKSQTAEISLRVSEKILKDKLKKGHHYRWALIPKGSSGVVVYSETFFQW